MDTFESLRYAERCLWWLIVQNSKGELHLTSDQLAVIDQAQRIAEDALKQEEKA